MSDSKVLTKQDLINGINPLDYKDKARASEEFQLVAAVLDCIDFDKLDQDDIDKLRIMQEKTAIAIMMSQSTLEVLHSKLLTSEPKKVSL